MLAVNSIAIPDQVMRHVILRKRLDNLLRSPDGGRMVSNVEVEDASPVVCEDDKHIQHVQLNRR